MSASPNLPERSDETVVAGVDLLDPSLARSVTAGLTAVEELLQHELASSDDFLTEAALHLARAGGKRFRPLFVLLTAGLGPRPSDPEVVTAATVIELVHLATLYHDDVMDEASVRRGATSVNTRWSNSVAILSGDYLFAHASRLVSTLGPDAVRIIAETFAELVTGQLRETVGPRDGQDSVEHYLRVVWGKTGSLIAAAGRFGGRFSGADDEQVEALGRFGDAVGTAFQIADDIIDISSVAEESGKVPGTDLREGVRTLPVLYALADDDDAPDARRLRELVAEPIHDDAHVREAIELLDASAGMARAKVTLREYADRGLLELDRFADSPAKTALRGLVEYTIARVG